jgi:outer membrane protein OmpA-like peptidoglycan-associated protein/tetratricopeptide (TPR) repeat protein
MKVLFSVFLFTAFVSIGQTLDEADKLFNRYEYSKAINAYEKYQATKKLSLKQVKNLTFSYFSVGDFDRAYRMTDSLVKSPNIESFFIYAHGYSAYAIGKYDVAKKYLIEYRTKEKNKDLDQMIKAIDVINTWPKEPLANLKSFTNNSSRADATIDVWKGNVIALKEKGITKTAEVDKNKDLIDAEFLYKVPYIVFPIQTEDIQVASSGLIWNEISVTNPPITYMTFNAISVSENGVVVCNLSGYDKQGNYIKPANYKGTLSEKLIIENLSPFLAIDSLESTSIAINDGGNVIVFSAKPKSKKDSDLYRMELVNGNWAYPTKINQLNTSGNDVFPVFSGDSILYFSSDGRMGYGGLDVYSITIGSGDNSLAKHLPSPINGASDDYGFCSITKDSIMFASNRFNGQGDDDIFTYSYPTLREIVSKKDTMDTVKTVPFVSVKNIVFYFDFDSYVIKDIPDSLTEFIDFLNANKSYQLVLVGRTDNIGTTDYNSYLGEMRAKAVAKLLTSKGVDSSKLKVISKGETDPVIRCSPCNAASNAKNRLVNLDIVNP